MNDYPALYAAADAIAATHPLPPGHHGLLFYRAQSVFRTVRSALDELMRMLADAENVQPDRIEASATALD